MSRIERANLLYCSCRPCRTLESLCTLNSHNARSGARKHAWNLLILRTATLVRAANSFASGCITVAIPRCKNRGGGIQIYLMMHEHYMHANLPRVAS